MLRMDWKATLPGKMENPDGLSQITDMEEWPGDSEFSTYDAAKLEVQLSCDWKPCPMVVCIKRSWNARGFFVHCKVKWVKK